MKINLTFIYLLLLGLATFGCKKSQDANKNLNPMKTETPDKESAIVAGDTNRYIDFESATLSSTDYFLTDNGNTFNFITKGTYSNPQLNTSEHFKGNTSVVYQMPHTVALGTVTNDKSQHRIFGGSQDIAMGFNDKRYYGFALKLDSSTEQPTAPCQLFQIWQGSPMSPPVDLSIAPGGSGNTFVIKLYIRNNNTTANPSAVTTIYTGSIIKGEWNTFVLMAIMRNTTDSQNGELKLWLNGVEVVRWYGRVGYADGIIYAGNNYTPNAKFDTFFGPYRACQQANLKVYYDQVRYATTYSAADPDQ